MQRTGRIRAGRINLVARPFWIEPAAQFDQHTADEHVAQDRRVRRGARYFDDPVHLEAHADALAKRLFEPDRPLRINRAVHRHAVMRVRVIEHRARLIQVRSVCRQVMHIGTGTRGQHFATPAVGFQIAVGHARAKRDRKVAAAPVRELEQVVLLARNARRSGANQRADQLGGETRLRGTQQVEIAEKRDLDPALPLATQPETVGMPRRAEPGRDDKGGLLQDRLYVVRNFHHVGGVAGDDHRADALRQCQAADGRHHARIEQLVGQEHQFVVGTKIEGAHEIADGLEVKLGLGGRQRVVPRQRFADQLVERHDPAAAVDMIGADFTNFQDVLLRNLSRARTLRVAPANVHTSNSSMQTATVRRPAQVESRSHESIEVHCMDDGRRRQRIVGYIGNARSRRAHRDGAAPPPTPGDIDMRHPHRAVGLIRVARPGGATSVRSRYRGSGLLVPDLAVL